MDRESQSVRTAQLDRATAERLARLHDLPLSEAGFREALDARLDAEPPLESALLQVAGAMDTVDRRPLTFWLGRLVRSRTLAASLLIVASVTALLLVSTDESVQATPRKLAAIHQHMQHGHAGHQTPVTSAAAADAVLRPRWAALPPIPQPREGRIMACCLHRLDHQQVACVSLEVDGVPVTMAVAEDLAGVLPTGRVLQRGSLTHEVQSLGGIQMVLTEYPQGWVCLIGALSSERLMALAAGLVHRPDPWPGVSDRSVDQ